MNYHELPKPTNGYLDLDDLMDFTFRNPDVTCKEVMEGYVSLSFVDSNSDVSLKEEEDESYE